MGTRKNDHIRICASSDVESSGAPFARVRLVPEALPDFALEHVDTATSFLGATCRLPLLITGMTGGVERGQEINETLAIAAQSLGIPMGLGSQKIMLSRPETRALFDVRRHAPDIFLIGNVGVVSGNYGVTETHVRRMVDDLGLNAFALHLNALQECVQPEGERNFTGALRFVERVARALPVPVLVKEVGSGMSAGTFRRLVDAGARAVDVGGRGGTSWSVIEGLRADARGRRLGELFRNWGLTTEESLVACAQVCREHLSRAEFPLVATGGIRDGLQVAKAVAMGARLCGVGLPLFRAVVNPPAGCTALEAVLEELYFLRDSLKIAMFCSGARTLTDLPGRAF
jgi:isopentenyl-diphosphate delta-isomerase